MSRYAEIVAELCNVLAPFAEGGQALTEDTRFVTDLGLNSLKILDLLMEVEDRFDVSVPLNILPEVHTVRDLAMQLENLTGAAQQG